MPSAHITTIDAAAISEDAYLFAYPLVLAELTRVDMTSVSAADPHTERAPLNELVHARRRPDARVRTSVGASTLNTSAWLDLAGGPVVLSVPETHGRYYVMSIIDMWTNAFASIGPRTTGTGAGAYAIGSVGLDGLAVVGGRAADHRPYSLCPDRRPDVHRARRVRCRDPGRSAGLRSHATQPVAGRAAGGGTCARHGSCQPPAARRAGRRDGCPDVLPPGVPAARGQPAAHGGPPAAVSRAADRSLHRLRSGMDGGRRCVAGDGRTGDDARSGGGARPGSVGHGGSLRGLVHRLPSRRLRDGLPMPCRRGMYAARSPCIGRRPAGPRQQRRRRPAPRRAPTIRVALRRRWRSRPSMACGS